MRREDLAACRELMRGGSRSFHLASLALPGRVRAPAAALYAFCRLADDAIDDAADAGASLTQLRQRLDAVYAGRAQAAVADRALAAVVAETRLPRALLDALLEGFAWDAQGRRYDTLDDLHGYAARVAGSVGAMMALLMQVRDARSLARASELGVAMQLTNIARDVGEDARRGRLYLPRRWLRDAGLDPEAFLAAPAFDARLAAVIRRLLGEAGRLYARAECGVSSLPHDCRPAIQAARLLYAEIGHQLLRRGGDSVNARSVVATPRKLVLLMRAVSCVAIPPGHPIAAGAAAPPLPAVAFLVDAAASAERPRHNYYQRTLRVLDLLQDQALRQRQA